MIQFFSEQCNVETRQAFWVKSTEPNENIGRVECVVYKNAQQLKALLKKLPKDTRIVIHGSFDPHVWLMLLFRRITSRCSCVFWGADVYRHNRKPPNWKWRLVNLLHLALVNRYDKLIALNSGDGQLISSLLKRSDAQVIPYPLIGLDPEKIKNISKSNTAPLKILLGSSAAPSNEHEFALDKLKHLAKDNIEIHAPLNYAGTDAYIDEVISFGNKIFGEKFIPITDMMEKSVYDNLLNEMDVCVMAHNRQQGLYAIYAMLMMGKSVFLRSGTSSFKNFESLGISLAQTESLPNCSFKDLVERQNQVSVTNQKLMKENFTEQALAPKWSTFLNGLLKS